jgi:sulfoquinovosyltransferase
MTFVSSISKSLTLQKLLFCFVLFCFVSLSFLLFITHNINIGKNYLGFIPQVENICWNLLRMAHSRADLTLVTSPQMKEELIKNGIPRVDIWRKGIDTIKFHPKFKSDTMRLKMTNNNSNELTLVYVGRLGAEKRLKDIKPVLDQLQANGIKVRMCFVGNGPQKDELQLYFDSSNTVFLGQLHGNELSSAFASADVFIMPSDSETLGFVVLESMASGVPVIGCAAGGILDLIHDGVDGYLVQPGDTAGYVAKLKLLSSNQTLRNRIGQQARTEAELWGWEAATSYLRNVQYEKALINFHSRAFGGFGRPGTAGLWRLLRYRIQGFVRKVTQHTYTIPSSLSIYYTSIKITLRNFVRRIRGVSSSQTDNTRTKKA